MAMKLSKHLTWKKFFFRIIQLPLMPLEQRTFQTALFLKFFQHVLQQYLTKCKSKFFQYFLFFQLTTCLDNRFRKSMLNVSQNFKTVQNS